MHLKIALCQMEVIPGRPDINTTTMLQMIKNARQKNAAIIIFPEMSVPGYLLADTWEQQTFLKDCEAYGQQIIQAAQDTIVIYGNIAMDWAKKNNDGRVRKYNAFFIAQNGRLAGGDNFPYPFRIKTLLPNYREFDDQRHFYSLQQFALDAGQLLEDFLTPVYLNIKGQKIGLGCLICEDGWDENYTVKPLATLHQKGGVHLWINISSSPFTLGKNNKRNRIFAQQARKTGLPLIYVNNVGIQNNGKTIYTFDGSSTVYNRQGDIVCWQPPFIAGMDLVDLAICPENSHQINGPDLPQLETPADQNISYLYQALVYGIKKFTATIQIDKVVIGISGGIDSAVAAALYVQALGAENIILVNMPSVYSSETTKNLALKLAKNLKCLYTVIPIQDVVDYTIKQLENTPVINPVTKKEYRLNISAFIVENIQARDRSTRILAAVAAAFKGVFTCNANKTELTVGYSTLYGDQAGFMAALADLWKYQIYDLAKYLNERVYQCAVIPGGIINLVPCAELSAAQSVDAGKGDPLTYPYHDYLFRSFVEEWHRATPEDILDWYGQGILEKKLGCQAGIIPEIFPEPQQFIADLEYCWRLFNGIGLAKRIQTPPVLAVSRRAYGFDYRESQNGVYFTQRYYRLKEKLLAIFFR